MEDHLVELDALLVDGVEDLSVSRPIADIPVHVRDARVEHRVHPLEELALGHLESGDRGQGPRIASDVAAVVIGSATREVAQIFGSPASPPSAECPDGRDVQDHCGVGSGLTELG